MVDIANSSDEHPDEQQLQAFATGRLDGIALDQIASHIASCESCLKQVEQLSIKNDTLLEDLREVGSSGNFEVVEHGPLSPDMMREAIERQSKYRVIEQLGSGGMGSVYLAEHLVMHRKVAVKVIRKEFVANPDAVARFKNEVRNAARLSHRNIVTAHDAEQVDDIHFLVMEHVPGESLSQLVRRKGPLPVKHACNFIWQTAHGLNHAHEHQMVHRDIKPANLMRTPRGVIKILDFGLARVTDIDENSAITTTGIMMGTADYIAPEQARDAKTADIRSDLYSLGCTFYFLLTGEPPFRAETKVDKIMAHCSTEFPNVANMRDDIPEEVSRIISKLTAKDPDERYQTPRELIDDLAPLGKPKPETQTTIESGNPRLASDEPAETSLGSKTDAPVPAVGTIADTTTGNLRPAVWKPVALFVGSLCMLIPLVWFLLATLLNKNEDDHGSKTGPAQKQLKVLLVMSSKNFWFSDYEPLARVLSENDVSLIVTADRAGTANFNPLPLDKAPNKRAVEIEKSVTQLVAEKIYDEVDAVVFIGTDTLEFRGQDQVGQSVRQLLNEMRKQGKWITSVGKGSEVPLEYGLYNDIEVCESQYIDDRARQNSKAVMVQQRVHVVENSKVLTCSMWDDAEAFAKKLVEILKNR